MTVDLFIPCFVDQFYPETAFSMMKVLRKAGVDVHYNPEQTCCGQMAFNSGFWDEAKALGGKFLKDFPHDRPVVGPSASCTAFIRNSYQQLFHNTSNHLEFKRIIKNIYELTDFLVNQLGIIDFGARFEHKVTFHDSCSGLREYGLKNEARMLLSKVKGLELVEMQDRHVCCGFGGTFSIKNEAVSVAMAEQKVQHALDTEAEYMVSTDLSCLMHLQSYVNKYKLPIKTIHIADILAAGW
ncbi:MAG: (Fe-S)-binding protein [Bacteroidales bacterium]|nr:(Fe-S)-binding protein [Bacteroidales bacterium]